MSFPSRALIVSIHDVSPFTQTATESMLKELRALGVDRCSLLVVPNHHHRGHFLEHPEFCEWLRHRVSGGDEAVIHGYFHQRASRHGESARDQIVTRFYTAGEGEFYDLSEEQARALVGQAREEFRAAGFDPVGFIAPAWLLNGAGERALQSLGIQYTTRLRTVTNLQTRTVRTSQSLVFSVRSAWRRACSRAWNAMLFHRLKSNPLMRLGIHPPDYEHLTIWQQIRRLAAGALVNRQPMTYAQWTLPET